MILLGFLVNEQTLNSQKPFDNFTRVNADIINKKSNEIFVEIGQYILCNRYNTKNKHVNIHPKIGLNKLTFELNSTNNWHYNHEKMA